MVRLRMLKGRIAAEKSPRKIDRVQNKKDQTQKAQVVNADEIRCAALKVKTRINIRQKLV